MTRRRRRRIPTPRLYRKSTNTEARLAYLGHLLMENRHGLIMDAQATVADGFAEQEAATTMLSAHWRFAPRRHHTVGADNAYDTADFVEPVRQIDMMPHVAQNDTRRGGSVIDARTTRHPSYAMSQHARSRVERAFGWLKAIAGLRPVKLRGLPHVDTLFVFASAVQHQTDRHAAGEGRVRRGGLGCGPRLTLVQRDGHTPIAARRHEPFARAGYTDGLIMRFWRLPS